LDSDAGQNVAPEPDASPGDRCTPPGDASAERALAAIDHVVVLCMENRSFDHVLGSLRFLEGRPVDGLKGTEANPNARGEAVSVYLLEDFTPRDPPHTWSASHAQWNGGLNDGFVKEHEGDAEAQVMGYHTRAQLPATYALADGGALCDRWFSSVLGPTWPNRYYLHGATSGGQKTNLPAIGFRSVFSALDDAGVSHKNYYHDIAWASGGYGKTSGLSKIEEFFADAALGTLPAYSLIDPRFFGRGANDDHPDHDVMLGQALIASVVAALAQSPLWSRSLFVLTYDEHGGFHDHVPPPTTVDSRRDFAQLGFRVPAVVAGPYVRAGCVVSEVLEHTSVISTLTRRFGLEPLNARVEATRDLSVCLDGAKVGWPRPAPVLPSVPVSRRALLSRPEPKIYHPELWELAERGAIPHGLDRRHEGLDLTFRVLACGERLGAVTLLD
jgi:phospholipase C